MNDPIIELYERYKHIDKPMSSLAGDSFTDFIVRDMWLAIKRYAQEKQKESGK